MRCYNKFCAVRRRLLGLSGAALVCLSLAGCKKEEQKPPPEPVDPNFPVTVELGGETVTIQKKPEAIVSLSPSITTALMDMELDGSLIGVSNYCTDLPGAAAMVSCGTAQNIDIEAVKKLRPQIVLTDTPLLSQQLTALYQMDAEVLVLPRPEDMEQLTQRQQLLAQVLLGKEEGSSVGQQYTEEFLKEWEKATQPVHQWLEEQETFSAVLLTDLNNGFMATGDTFEGKMLEQLGFTNLARSGRRWQYQPEEGEEFAPQVIFYDSSIDPETILGHPLYKETPAVQEERLYPVDWENLHLQGETMVEEYRAMAGEYYPEAFEKAQEAEEQEETEGEEGSADQEATQGQAPTDKSEENEAAQKPKE